MTSLWDVYNSEDSFLPFWGPLIMWVYLYFYGRATGYHFHESLILQNLHKATVIILGISSLYINDDQIFNERIPILYSLSYFLLDFVDSVVRQDYAHTAYAFFPVTIGISNYKSPACRTLRIFSKACLIELSTPFLFLAKHTRKPFYFLVFVLVFTCCRMIWVPLIILQAHYRGGMKIGSDIRQYVLCGFYLYSCFLYSKMIKIVIKAASSIMPTIANITITMPTIKFEPAPASAAKVTPHSTPAASVKSTPKGTAETTRRKVAGGNTKTPPSSQSAQAASAKSNTRGRKQGTPATPTRSPTKGTKQSSTPASARSPTKGTKQSSTPATPLRTANSLKTKRKPSPPPGATRSTMRGRSTSPPPESARSARRERTPPPASTFRRGRKPSPSPGLNRYTAKGKSESPPPLSARSNSTPIRSNMAPTKSTTPNGMSSSLRRSSLRSTGSAGPSADPRSDGLSSSSSHSKRVHYG